ncbi:MAG TPA: nitronate monooxygenase, partial [Aggregatilineales bacterium]|nr:nitronate monooxygenase [Aggregatilineales bacterium]
MIEITVSRKNSIVVDSPVLFAAGVVGFDGTPYRKILALDKFGALVTTPVTLTPRFPANGPRVVPLTSGLLLHTGLPNPGVRRTVQEYEASWKRSILPIIMHLVATSADDVEQMARVVDGCPEIDGIEIGLHDQVTIREMRAIISAAKNASDLPILARLPLYSSLTLAEPAQDSGIDALVIAAPPRGTERDQQAGRLVGGRLYGPWLKAQTLRIVGRVVQYTEVPIIASGGIHSADDARDFITAGATAVQLDSIVWINPKEAEVIARNLGGSELTRTSGALADEWQPGMSTTQRMRQQAPP